MEGGIDQKKEMHRVEGGRGGRKEQERWVGREEGAGEVGGEGGRSRRGGWGGRKKGGENMLLMWSP